MDPNVSLTSAYMEYKIFIASGPNIKYIETNLHAINADEPKYNKTKLKVTGLDQGHAHRILKINTW